MVLGLLVLMDHLAILMVTMTSSITTIQDICILRTILVSGSRHLIQLRTPETFFKKVSKQLARVPSASHGMELHGLRELFCTVKSQEREENALIACWLNSE